mmetsp:Transcript_15735/g.43410  ORF Transcript_15735/g.43410 Transcript_15735/m.43410 type:complete len:565 (+) Transcript_15735:62-1756(+)
MGNFISSSTTEQEEGRVEVEENKIKQDQDEGVDNSESKAREQVVFDNDALPKTSSPGQVIHQQKKGAPGNLLCCCFGHSWHATHTTLTLRDGTQYQYNARSHRKMRFLVAVDHDIKAKDTPPFRFFCWEPQIVTWYICWIGVIANSLWVINGVFAVWPELTTDFGAEMITYTTGVIGAFLFIVTAYLGYVEAINHTHADVHFPPSEQEHQEGPQPLQHQETNGTCRQFRRPNIRYGQWQNPVAPEYHEEEEYETRLIAQGYPLIQDVETKRLVTPQVFENFFEQYENNALTSAEMNAKLFDNGREFDIRIGSHVVRVKPTEWKRLDQTEENEYSRKVAAEQQATSLHNIASPHNQAMYQGYRWWTWRPDLHHIGIVNALVFFIATILFFLPAALWYPMGEADAPLPSTIFWVYVLQIIPSIGFIYVGWASMAEVSGSWLGLALGAIGWWIGFFNFLGGWGFLLYPVLFLPEEVDPGNHGDLAKWGAAFATFWGSCFFWVAGILECIEFSNQHPISIMNGGSGGGENHTNSSTNDLKKEQPRNAADGEGDEEEGEEEKGYLLDRA